MSKIYSEVASKQEGSQDNTSNISQHHPKAKSYSFEEQKDENVSLCRHRCSLTSDLGSLEHNNKCLDFSSLKLYGRDQSMKHLQDAYSRVCRRECHEESMSSASNEVVLISGRSGTGKTSLVHSFRDTVRSKGVFFASGKFEMRKQHMPYAAFGSVFDELCDHLMSVGNTFDPSSILKIRSDIRDAIGSEGAPMLEIAPKLSLVLRNGSANYKGRASTVEGCEKTRNKLKFLMRRFMHSFCIHEPLLLFLDDVQWADMASIDLIKTLCSDKNNSGLLVILSCRDGENGDEDTNQQLVQFVDDIVTSTTIVTSSIAITNLDVKSINCLLADVLTSTVEKTQALAYIVHGKTHGNAFAVTHFIKNMQDEGLLKYCFASLTWKWNDEEVQTSMKITENVAELVTSKLREKLPAAVRKVLQIAACLGENFGSETMSFLMEEVQIRGERSLSILQEGCDRNSIDTSSELANSAAKSLNFCVKEGLMERDDNNQYRFSHDQVATASFALIPDDELQLIQLHIGEALLTKLSRDELEKNIFVVVGLMNKGLKLILSDNKKRQSLSRLNLQAGKKAMRSSAFESAISYVKIGIDLLGPNHWRDDQQFCVDLFTTAAQIESCLGHVEETEFYLSELFRQDLPIKEKVEAYKIQLHLLQYVQTNCNEVFDLAVNVLDQLGVHFPKAGIGPFFLKEFIKTRMMIKRVGFRNLKSLPFMKDETKICAMQILECFVENCHGVKPLYFLSASLKMAQYSVQYGISKYSAIAFVALGIVMRSIVKNFKESYQYGKLGMIILERCNDSDRISQVLHGRFLFLNHWVEPAHLVQKSCFDAYSVGMQTGDIIHAMLNLRSSINFAIFVGKPLKSIDEDIKSSSEQMEEYRQERCLFLLLPVWQFALNLMGKSSDPKILTGNVMQQKDLLKSSEESGDEVLKQFIKVFQVWVSFYFGEFESAGCLMKELKDMHKTLPSTPLLWRQALFEGLIAFSLSRKKHSNRWKKHAFKITSKVKKWLKKGNVNCLHMFLLFEAEIAALEGNTETAIRKYNEAISITARCGFIHDRALANERAGEFMFEKGDGYSAAYYLKVARSLYLRWGAKAKADDLYLKYQELLSKETKAE